VDTQKAEREERNYQPIPNIYRFDNIPELLENNRTRICNDIRKILAETQKSGSAILITNK
jgi:hypothetical protein